ncbi:MAG: hemerythrin domain-containing protein [Microthrixaceae bacterium]
MSDAITQLKDDHAKVEKLFKKYEDTTDRAMKTRRKLVDQMIEELSVHAAIEEQVFYPISRVLSAEAEEQTLESLEEHHLVKVVLAELTKLEPDDERFHPKVTVLMENIRHHVEEEENDLFPMMREAFGRNDMSDLGDALNEARKLAPTRPHPGSPDTPPANLATGLVAGIIDRIRSSIPV